VLRSLFFALVFLVLIAGCTQPSSDPGEERVIGDPSDSYDAETVLDRVERIYGLNATSRIRVVEVSPEQLQSEYEPKNISTPVRRTLLLYPDEDTTSFGPGGYVGSADPNSQTKRVLLVDAEAFSNRDGVHDVFDQTGAEQKQELLLVHEMTHIIQSDWGLNDGVTNTLDGSLTRTALAEGEAVYIEIQYARRYVSTPVNVSTKLARVSRQGDWRRQLIASPYVVGYKYWSNLDTPPTERHRLLKNGPETTAEVLHPSRNVSVPGEPLPPVNIQGTKRGPPNRVGELAIRVALRTNGVRNNRAARAADGWRNDSLAVYDTDEGRLTSWQIRFENRSEAQEFVRAWTAMLHRTGEALGDGEYSVTPSDSQPTLYYDVSMEGEIVHVEMSPARNVITETNTTETERRSFVMLGRIEKASNTLHPHYN